MKKWKIRFKHINSIKFTDFQLSVGNTKKHNCTSVMRANIVFAAIAFTLFFTAASSNNIFKLKDEKAVMYSVSEETMSWIKAVRVSLKLNDSYAAGLENEKKILVPIWFIPALWG